MHTHVHTHVRTPMLRQVLPSGFSFEFADRTMGQRRAGTGEFRAPYVVTYNAAFERKTDPKSGELLPPKFFNLTVVCLPTSAGQSRAIIYGGVKPLAKHELSLAAKGAAQSVTAPQNAREAAERPSSLAARLFRSLPVWLVHLGSNRFLDSDLAFLHYQEQVILPTRNDVPTPPLPSQATCTYITWTDVPVVHLRIHVPGAHTPNEWPNAREQVLVERGGDASRSYFLPTESDRCISALRRWISSYAHVLAPLPPPQYDRQVRRHARSPARSFPADSYRKPSAAHVGAAARRR